MTDTDRLRDLLEQAAPAHPEVDPTTRAAAVARRGRSTRRRELALVTAVAIAVVALPIAIPLAVGRGDRPQPEPPNAAVGNPTQPCPAAPVDTSTLSPVPGLGDVTVVRSCPVQDPGGDPLPAEPLIGDAAQAFADDVAALPAYQMPAYCAMATFPTTPWALQLQTVDGDLVTVGSPMNNDCSAVKVGGADRGADRVVAAFAGNLARQRSGVPALACPQGDRLADGAATWNASFDISSATSGIVCSHIQRFGSPQQFPTTEGALDADQLATIVADLATGMHQETDGRICVDGGQQRLLVLANDAGDQVAFVDDHCSGEFAGPGGYWKPGAAAEQAIGATLGN